MIRNALWVYLQKLITAGITLFSTPLLLRNLGVENYGIYNLTLGLVALFGFINWSLTSSTQRFIAVCLNSQIVAEKRITFSTSFFIHVIYGLLLLIIVLIIGGLYISSFLNVPISKISIARTVMFFVAIITFFQMLGVPFQGLLQAYENFKVVSFVNIIDSIVKLIAASILFLSPIDKLVFFSVLMSVSSLLIYLILMFYCISKYEEASVRLKYFSVIKFKEMMGFTSWNLVGGIAILGRNQGIAVVLNYFFGVVANAAYGVALQIQAAVGVFTQGIISAMTPRILKQSNNSSTDSMLKYSFLTAKYSLYIMSIVGVPLMINMEGLLQIWLKVIPKDSVVYSNLVIIFLLCSSYSLGIQTIFQGINKVKYYNLIVSTLLLLNLPISVLLFRLGLPSYSVFIVSIGLESVSFLVRLHLLKIYINYSVWDYVSKLLLMFTLPFLLNYVLLVIILPIFVDFYLKFVFSIIFTLLFQSLIFYKVAMEKDEKLKLKVILDRVIRLTRN